MKPTDVPAQHSAVAAALRARARAESAAALAADKTIKAKQKKRARGVDEPDEYDDAATPHPSVIAAKAPSAGDDADKVTFADSLVN